MTRFAFVAWDGGGNVPPAIGIAQELASRGHDVFFVGYEVQRNGFEGKGLKFSSLRRSGQFDIYGAVSPSERIAGLMTNVWASAEHLADVPDALEATGANVVVIDFMMQGALAAAYQLDSPVAVLAHSSIAGLIPPPASPMGAARLTATNSLRLGAGLPLLSRLNEGWSGLQTLVTTIPALDPAADGAERCVHYVGPVFENFPGESWVSPWGPEDNRPLVLVSFSTTGLWDQRGRIRNTLEALAGEPVRVLVSAPQGADIAPLPDNAAVRGFVPHSLVLPGAAATVTHAGHGTVTASLAHGVPIVAYLIRLPINHSSRPSCRSSGQGSAFMERPGRRIFEWPFGRSCVTSHMPPPLRTSRPRSGPRPGPQARLSNLNAWRRQDVHHLADD